MNYSNTVMGMCRKAPEEVMVDDARVLFRVMQAGLDALGQHERDEMNASMEQMSMVMAMAMNGKPMNLVMAMPKANGKKGK